MNIIDQFAELHEFITPYLDKYEKLKKEVTALAAADKSNDPISLVGEKFEIDYTAPSQTQKCLTDPKEFIELTGKWECLSISTTEAKKHLSPSEMSFLFTAVNGSRRFKRVRNRVSAPV